MLLIRGGKIKPIVGEEMENGELLIGDDGKIAAIGQKVDAPEGVEVLDASGCLVTPGFIDAHCHIGIDEEGVRWEGNDTNEYSSPVTPELQAIDGINPRCEAFANALAGGVTTAVTGPGSANVLGGSFVALKLYGDCVDDMVVKYPAAMKIAFGENPKGCYGQNGKKEPVTRMAIAALLREQLFKAKRYAAEVEAAEKDPDKTRPFDMQLEALLPVLSDEVLDFNDRDTVFDACKAKAEELGKKNGWLLYPLGIALSGKQRTPGGGTDLACMMGREKTLERVKAAIEKLNG